MATGERVGRDTGVDVSGRVVTSTGSTTARTLAARFADVVNVRDFGAVGDGTTDDTAAIQAAINTGWHVLIPSGASYRITDSLYMATTGQQMIGGGTILMDAALGKPCLWVGATSSAGTLPAAPITNMAVRGIRFLGAGGLAGSRTLGSAGIAFGKATTTVIDGVFAWYFHAGIDVRGTSLANTLSSLDVRYNVVGVKDDRQTTVTGPDLQASVFLGGRIEANRQEGVVLGSANVSFVGTVIEGNGAVANGGDGTSSEVKIVAGFQGGSAHFTSCYMETLSANTSTGMIYIAPGTTRAVTISGGTYIAGSTSRYIIDSASLSTVQSYSVVGGYFYDFKNYVRATIQNNSFVSVVNAFSDATRVAATDVTASAGASVTQIDRATLASSLTLAVPKVAPTAASGEIGVQMQSGARVDLGSSKQVWTDGTNVFVGASGNVYLGGGTGVALAGSVKNGAAAAMSVAGDVADGATAVAVKVVNGNALSADGARIAGFYSDNGATLRAGVNALGGLELGSPSAARERNAIYAGSGAPSDANGANGDFYFRTDTPGSASQRLYVKSAGAWTGIL